MKAARYHLGEHGRLEVDDVPEPVPGPGQVRLQVAYSGICGSDLARYRQLPDPPESLRRLLGKVSPIPGHEFSGWIDMLGDGVPANWPDGEEVKGSRAVAHPTVACGECDSCRAGYWVGCEHPEKVGLIGLRHDGGMGEYVAVPFDHIVRVQNKDMDLRLAALTEPVAVALHAIQQAHIDDHLTPVCVIGDGAIGILIAHILYRRGYTRVRLIGRHTDRLAMARQVGVGENILADDAGSDLNASARIVFHTAGTQAALEMGMRLLQRGGGIICLGYLHGTDAGVGPDLFYDLIRREKTVKGSVGYSYNEFESALHKLGSGFLNAAPIISAEIPLSAIVTEGFDPLTGDNPPPGKILVRMSGNPGDH